MKISNTLLTALTALLASATGMAIASTTVLAASVPPSPVATCLTGSSPQLKLSGYYSSAYKNKNISNGTLLDARSGNWTITSANKYDSPYGLKLYGTGSACWQGGKVKGVFTPDAVWEPTYHSSHAINANMPYPSFHGVYLENFGDGISFGDKTQSFEIVSSYIGNMHDDCIEGDYLPSGTISDTLMEGCYQAFALRPRSGNKLPSASNKTWAIKNTLVHMRPQKEGYKPQEYGSPTQGSLFKWDNSEGKSPKVALENVIFRVDAKSAFDIAGMGVPNDKLASCSNVTIVWLGGGSYPMDSKQTAFKQCAKITTDASVWNNAVREWKQNHGL